MSKIVAFVVGGAFIFVQTLSFNGMIDVNYDGIQKHVEVSRAFISTMQLAVWG